MTISHPLRWLRQKVRQFWLQRLALSDVHHLRQSNVYIIPSRAGLMLGVTLALLLLASINYQLNLGYLLTFMLTGAALAGMHRGHANLRDLQLELRSPHPTFAGTPAQLEVTLHNPRTRARYGVGIAVLGNTEPDWRWTDVPAHGSAQRGMVIHAPLRGCHPLPPLTIESRYPLGSFRVWSVWRPASMLWVYPAPENTPPALPWHRPHPSGAEAWVRNGAEDLDGIRAYRKGDALKHVVWKKMAKSSQWLSREGTRAEPHALWLDFANCYASYPSQAGAQGAEQRLSRLTAWVLRADRQGLSFGLRLPGQRIEPGHGPAHCTACLMALALWQPEPAP
jgi:uncharacterized protein (DUF58 family)